MDWGFGVLWGEVNMGKRGRGEHKKKYFEGAEHGYFSELLHYAEDFSSFCEGAGCGEHFYVDCSFCEFEGAAGEGTEVIDVPHFVLHLLALRLRMLSGEHWVLG